MLDSEFDSSDKSEQDSKPFDPKVDLTSTNFKLVRNTITWYPHLRVSLASDADVCWPDRNLPTLLGNVEAESALEYVRKTAPNILTTEHLIGTLEYAAAIRRVFPGITAEQLNSVKTDLHNDEGLLDSARKTFHYAREQDPQDNTRLLEMLSIAAHLKKKLKQKNKGLSKEGEKKKA